MGREPREPITVVAEKEKKSLCSKISGHSMIPGTSFRRGPESSVIYASTRGRHLGSGFRRSDEYIATGPIDAFDTGSNLDFVRSGGIGARAV